MTKLQTYQRPGYTTWQEYCTEATNPSLPKEDTPAQCVRVDSGGAYDEIMLAVLRRYRELGYLTHIYHKMRPKGQPWANAFTEIVAWKKEEND